jgi:hypothetical protein
MEKTETIYTNRPDTSGQEEKNKNQENSNKEENQKQEKQDGDKDIILNVDNLQVEEIKLKVEELKAKVSVNASVSRLVNLEVGADVCIDKVDVEIRGVDTELHFKVKLDKIQEIINRALDTIDKNADVLKNLNPENGSSGNQGSEDDGENLFRKAGERVGGVIGTAREKVGGAVESLGEKISGTSGGTEDNGENGQ